MFDCEICGKHTESLYVIDVEGAKLSVCANCSRGKEVIDEIDGGEKARKQAIVTKMVEPEEELVEGYGGKIRKARESMGIDLKVLGEMINEKHSTLLRVEEERMSPNIKLTEKLEKALGIKLRTTPDISSEAKVGRNEPLTLGDTAFTKKKKDE